eukprot:351993-Chlamydomonas_euryale.AAC.2
MFCSQLPPVPQPYQLHDDRLVQRVACGRAAVGLSLGAGRPGPWARRGGGRRRSGVCAGVVGSRCYAGGEVSHSVPVGQGLRPIKEEAGVCAGGVGARCYASEGGG